MVKFADPDVAKWVIDNQNKLKNKFREQSLQGTAFLEQFQKDEERKLAIQSVLSEKNELDFNGEKVKILSRKV
jgi:hypothetical protein